MPHYSRFTLLDRSKEKSGFSFFHGPLTALTLAGFLTQFGSLRTALDELTLGTLHKETIVLDDTVLSNDLPTSNWADRETKLLVVYRGNTSSKLYTLEIPMPNLDEVVFQAESDKVDIEDSPKVLAFKTAFEAIAKSPDDETEGVTIMSVRRVGRNL